MWTLVEEIVGLDITTTDSSSWQDSAFRKRLQDSYGVAVPTHAAAAETSVASSGKYGSCVSLAGAAPSKSGSQAILAVLVCPLSSTNGGTGGGLGTSAAFSGSSTRVDTDMFLLSDLHGVTARLAAGPGAARHHLLQTSRGGAGRGGGGGGGGGGADSAAGTVVLIIKPAVIFDPISKIAQLYLDSQTQLVVVGKARFYGKCVSKTKAGTACKVAVDRNRSDRCIYHATVRVALAPTVAQAEHAALANQEGLATLFGGSAKPAVSTVSSIITSASVSRAVSSSVGSERVFTSIKDSAAKSRTVQSCANSRGGAIVGLKSRHVPSSADTLALSLRVGRANGLHSNGVSGGLETGNVKSMLGSGSGSGTTEKTRVPALVAAPVAAPVSAPKPALTPQSQMIDSATRAAEAFHRRSEAVRGQVGRGAGGASMESSLIKAGIALRPVGTSASALVLRASAASDPLGHALNMPNKQRSGSLSAAAARPSAGEQSKARRPAASSQSSRSDSCDDNDVHTVRRGGDSDYDNDNSLYEGFGLDGSLERDGSVLIPQPAHDVFDRGAAVYRAGERPGQSNSAHTAQKVAMEQAVLASFGASNSVNPVAHAAAVQAVQWGVERSSDAMQPSMLGAMPPPPPSQQQKSSISKAAALKGPTSSMGANPSRVSGNTNKILSTARPVRPAFTGSAMATATGKYAMVGGVLVDVSKLESNSASNSSSTSNKAKTAAVKDQQAKRKASALDAEIEKLLGQSSSHAAEAEDLAFSTTIGHMDNLAKREYMQGKENTTTSIEITGFWCSDCNQGWGDRPRMCLTKSHRLLRKKTMKRFWECGKCFKRQDTFDFNGSGAVGGASISSRCSCGTYQWVACGSRGSGKLFEGRPGGGIYGERLILAAADGATRSDRDDMAARVSGINSVSTK